MTLPPHKQRGAVTLMGALVVIITLVLMIEVLHRMAASDILDTALHNDSVEALFVAESGIEHAAYLLAYGTACPDLAALTGTVDAGRGSFDIDTSTLVGSECYIGVSAAAGTLGAQRVVEAVLKNEGNLLGTANPDFDEPPPPCVAPGCTPTGWTLPAGGWRDGEGESGLPDDRAAYVEKTSPGSSTATTAGSFGLPPFTVAAPTTLTLTFDYKVVSAGPTSKEAELSFGVGDGTTSYTVQDESGHTGNYVSRSVTIDIGGTGPVTITEFSFILRAKSGQPKQIWLDNLDLRGPASGGSVTLRQWREVVSN